MPRLLTDRRFTILTGAVIAAGAVASFTDSSRLCAAPIFNLKILARNVTDGEAVFSSFLFSPNAGDVVEYQIVGNMSPVGTVYTGAGGFTITSLSANIDGVNSLRADLFELASDPTQANLSVGALTTNWAQAVDNSPGSLVPRGNGNNDISAIRPIRAAGNFGAIGEEVIYTGTMTLTATAGMTDSFLRIRWSTGSGSFHVNGSGLAKFPNLASETGTAPFIRYTPLIPEPTSLSVFGVAAIGLLARRRTPAPRAARDE